METQITFPNRQEELLSATLHTPEGPTERAVILGHCFTCSRHTAILRELGARLEKAGFLVLRFDFSGNGQSQGNFSDSSITKHIDEIRAAVQLMRKKGARWFALAGHSMGAAISILAGARLSEISAVAALAGRLTGFDPKRFLNPDQMADLEQDGKVRFISRNRNLELPRSFFEDADRHNLPQTLRAMNIPVLIVHGDQDEMIPVQEAYLAQKLHPDRIDLEIVPGANHMFSNPDHRVLIAQRITDWIIQQQGEIR